MHYLLEELSKNNQNEEKIRGIRLNKIQKNKFSKTWRYVCFNSCFQNVDTPNYNPQSIQDATSDTVSMVIHVSLILKCFFI